MTQAKNCVKIKKSFAAGAGRGGCDCQETFSSPCASFFVSFSYTNKKVRKQRKRLFTQKLFSGICTRFDMKLKKPYRICSVRYFTKRGLSNGSIPTQSHRGTSPSHGFPRNGIPKHAPLYGIRYSVGEFHPIPYHRIISFFTLYESFKNLSRFFHGKYLFFMQQRTNRPLPLTFCAERRR